MQLSLKIATNKKLDNSKCLREQLLSQSNDAAVLVEVLQCPYEQLEINISKLNKRQCTKLYNVLQPKSRALFMQAFLAKLHSWFIQSLSNQTQLYHSLLTIQEILFPSSYHKAEMIACLVDKIKNENIILQLLEDKFIQQHYSLGQQNCFKVFGIKIRDKLLHIYQYHEEKAHDNCNDKVQQHYQTGGQGYLIKLKVIKLYSWVFTTDSKNSSQQDKSWKQSIKSLEIVFDLEGIYNFQSKTMTKEQLKQLIQIKNQRAVALYQRILNIGINKTQNEELKMATDHIIDKKLINNSIYIQILKTAHSKIQFFPIYSVNDQQKNIIFKFNLINTPKQVFSNIIPHFLTDSSKESIQKRSLIFGQLLQKLGNIIDKIVDGFAICALDYNEGQIQIKQYSSQQIGNLLSICVLYWKNIYKLIEKGKTQNVGNVKTIYKQFFNCELMNINKMPTLFTKIMDYIQVHNKHKDITFIIDSLSFIDLKLEKYYKYGYKRILANKDFAKKIMHQIVQIMNKSPLLEDIVNILELICQRQDAFKQLEDQTQMKLLNISTIYNYLYQFDIKNENQYDGKQYNAGPYFAGIGKYIEKCSSILLCKDNINFSRYSQLVQFICQKLQLLTESIQIHGSYSISPIDEIRIEILMRLYSKHDINFSNQLNEKIINKIIKMMKSKNISNKYFNIGARQLFAKNIKINFHQQIEETAQRLLKFIQTFDTQSLDVRSCYDICSYQKKQIQQIKHLLYYLGILLTFGQKHSNKKNEYPAINLFKLIFSITKFKIRLDEKIAQFYAQMQISELKQQNAKAMEDQIKFQKGIQSSLESLYFSIENLLPQIYQYISQVPSHIFFHYMKQSKYVLDESIQKQKSTLVSWSIYIIFFLLNDHNNKNSVKIGINYWFLYKKQILEIVRVTFINRKDKQNKQMTPQHCKLTLNKKKNFLQYFLTLKQQAIQINCMAQFYEQKCKYQLCPVKRLLQQLLTVGRNPWDILIKEKKYSGYKNMNRVQKSILFTILQDIEDNFSIQMIDFYYYVITKICDNIKAIQGRKTKSVQKQTQLQIKIQTQYYLTVFNQTECEQVLTRKKLQFIGKLLGSRGEKSNITIRSIVDILFKGITQHYKYQNQILTILGVLIKSISDLVKQKYFNKQTYSNQLQWLNTFLEHTQKMNISSVISIALIKDFITCITEMINQHQKNLKQLELSIPLLDKFLPHDFSGENKDMIRHHSLKISQLISKIIFLTQTQNISHNVIESIIAKMMNSNILEIKKYIGIVITSLSINRLPDIICHDLSSTVQNICMELNIKGYFMRLSKQLGWQCCKEGHIEVKIDEFVYEFKQRYKNQWQRLIQISQQLLTIKKQKAYGNTFKIVYNNQKQDFFYSRFLQTQFTDYKPPLSFRFMLKNKLKNLSKDNKLNCEFLKQLQKIIHNYPIILPYIIYHPIKTEECQKTTFLDYILHLSLDNIDSHIQYRQFILFVLLDHSSIIRGSENYYMFSEVLCWETVNKLIKSTIDNSALLFILYLCQLKRFCYYCISPNQDQFILKQKIQEILMNCNIQGNKHLETKLLCSHILTMLYRFDSIIRLSHVSQLNNYKKAKYSKLIDSCTYPFDGLLARKTEKKSLKNQIKTTEKKMREALQLKEVSQKIKLKLKDSYILVNLFSQNEQNNFILKENILHSIGQTKPMLPGKQSTFCLDSTMSSNFIYVVNMIQKWCSKLQKKGISLRYLSYGPRQAVQQSYYGQQEEDEENPIIISRTQHSRYALNDYSYQYSYHRDMINTEDDKFQDVIVKRLKQKPQSSQKNDKMKEMFQKEGNSKTLIEDVSKIIKVINQNYRILEKQNFDLEQLKNISQNELIEYLKDKQIQSDFDVKERTMNLSDFQAYCLSNATKLQRLQSNRKDIVNQIQEEVLQFHIRRNSSSESIDYTIDIIDQNYQLLSPFNKEISPITSKKNDYKQEIKSQFQSQQTSINDFPEIKDEVLYQIISLFYFQIQGFKYEQFITILQNKKIQEKVVNTLLLMYRKPFETGIFPKYRYNVSQDKNQENQEIIRTKIAQFFKSFYTYALYKQTKLMQKQTSGICIREHILQPLPQFSDFLKNNHQLAAYQIIKIVSSLPSCKDQIKASLFRGIKQLPDTALIQALNFIKEKNAKYNADSGKAYNYINLKKQLDIEKNFKELSENRLFVTQFRQSYPPEDINLNPFLVGCFIPLKIYNNNQLKVLQRKILGQNNNTNCACLFLLNEILQIYSKQQLQKSDWLIQNTEKYQAVLQMYADKSKKIQKQLCYQMMIMIPTLQKRLSFSVKKKVLQAEIKSIRIENQFTKLTPEIRAKRKKGIFQSAFQDLRYMPYRFWMSQFSVKFISQNDLIESGYGQGVQKDWYTLVTQGMVNLDYGLFSKTQKNYYFFNRESWINPRHLQFFQFIGKLFALSIFKDGYFQSPAFSIIIYKMILNHQIRIEDLIEQFDEGQVIKNLQKLRQFTDDSMFWQTFIYEDVRIVSDKHIKKIDQIQKEQSQGSNFYVLKQTEPLKYNDENNQQSSNKIIKITMIGQKVQLIPGGSQIYVNLSNVNQYIDLTKKKIYDKIIKSVYKQAQAFVEGFKSIIDVKYLQKFTPQQLRKLAEGSNHIKVNDIKQNVNLMMYKQKDQPPVSWLWEIMEQLKAEQISQFMQHWTGSPKVPAQGVKSLNLSIMKKNKSTDKRIFSQTCFGRIMLPVFESKQEMREAVMTAINTVKFGLSILEDN